MCDGFKTGHDFHFNRTTGLHLKQCFKPCPCCLFVFQCHLNCVVYLTWNWKSVRAPIQNLTLRHLFTYSRLYFVYIRIWNRRSYITTTHLKISLHRYFLSRRLLGPNLVPSLRYPLTTRTKVANEAGIKCGSFPSLWWRPCCAHSDMVFSKMH